MKCVCIKNGYMLSGNQFCVVGEVYDYVNNSRNYTVNTIISNGHSMQNDFFHEYYVKHTMPFIMSKLNKFDFKI